MPAKIKTWASFHADRIARASADARRANDPARQAALRIYKSSTWGRLRLMQLSEFPLCRICGELGAHIDHIVPLRAGGAAYDQTNLQTLCASCHSKKTRQEAAEAAERGYN
jgi:5-methylcytosine-specific restriction protein A